MNRGFIDWGELTLTSFLPEADHERAIWRYKCCKLRARWPHSNAGAARNERREAYLSVSFSFGYFSFGEAKEK